MDGPESNPQFPPKPRLMPPPMLLEALQSSLRNDTTHGAEGAVAHGIRIRARLRDSLLNTPCWNRLEGCGRTEVLFILEVDS